MLKMLNQTIAAYNKEQKLAYSVLFMTQIYIFLQYSSFESLREFPRENSLFFPLENSPMVNQWDFPQGEFTIFPRENSPVNFRMNCTSSVAYC